MELEMVNQEMKVLLCLSLVELFVTVTDTICIWSSISVRDLQLLSDGFCARLKLYLSMHACCNFCLALDLNLTSK